MFEVSIAFKYLVPRLRYLSVSIISIISTLVIATVVWLTVIFFSVTEGLERRWTEKLVAITAPVRVIPTDEYYRSYYFLIDSISNESGYSYKSLSEKLTSPTSNPYNPETDAALSANFPQPLLDANGNLLDLAKFATKAITEVKEPKNIEINTFETAYANLKIQLFRNEPFSINSESSSKLITQASYLVNFDPKKLGFERALIPIGSDDLENVLQTIDNVSANSSHVQAEQKLSFDKLLRSFTDRVDIHTLKTPQQGFQIPTSALPEGKKFEVFAQFSNYLPPEIVLVLDEKSQTLVSEGIWVQGYIEKRQSKLFFIHGTTERPLEKVQLRLPGDIPLTCKLERDLSHVSSSQELPFQISIKIQGTLFQIPVLKSTLLIDTFSCRPSTQSEPLWLERRGSEYILPKNSLLGEGAILPKSFKESSVLLDDRGYFSYYAPSATSLQEQKIPFFTAGFYDPGIIPIGGKLILTRPDVVSLIQAAQSTDENLFPSGINVNFPNYKLAGIVKQEINDNLKKLGIDKFFTVQAYDEYDFTKDIFQQLKSERNLFSLISVIIVVVACSNIISMLIILVHDKQKEIAILRALGASKASIGFIFGLCGFLMGAVGSILGALLSYVTVKNMPTLLAFLGKLQGFDVLNTSFYGKNIPTEVSMHAMILVISATAIISTLAGAIAAFKASRQNTSDALRAE
jgi:lipoprotein-releasing system permease protein